VGSRFGTERPSRSKRDGGPWAGIVKRGKGNKVPWEKGENEKKKRSTMAEQGTPGHEQAPGKALAERASPAGVNQPKPYVQEAKRKA